MDTNELLENFDVLLADCAGRWDKRTGKKGAADVRMICEPTIRCIARIAGANESAAVARLGALDPNTLSMEVLRALVLSIVESAVSPEDIAYMRRRQAELEAELNAVHTRPRPPINDFRNTQAPANSDGPGEWL
jgi:hypothetical protein